MNVEINVADVVDELQKLLVAVLEISVAVEFKRPAVFEVDGVVENHDVERVGEVDSFAIGLDVVNPLFVGHEDQCGTVNAKRNLCRYLKARRGHIEVDEFQDFRLGVSLVDYLILQVGVVAVCVEKFCLHHQVGEGEFGVVADGGFEGRVAGLLEVTARVQHIVAHCEVRRARNLLIVRHLHSKFAKHCVC